MKTTSRFRSIWQNTLQLFFIFMVTFQSFAAEKGDQNGKLTLSLSNVTLQTVFSNIETNTDYSFFYENDLVNLNAIVSVEGTNITVENVLSQVLRGQGLSYNIVNKQIVLSRAKTNKLGNVQGQLQQLKTVTGTVSDSNGETLPGVNVSVKGSTKGTQTDFNGNYSINVQDSDTLVFSYVGFKTYEAIVAGQENINVTLEEDLSALNEVVVIGYGTAKKSDLAGSVAQLTTEAFEEQPITRVEEALQGRVAGVAISRNSGNPGDGAKIRIRGVNSISGSAGPQVIVDGVFGGDLRTINPNDIASIEVLKDASATAIYGSRGANGVILVTTKKGKGKPKLDLNYFTSVSTLAKKFENRISGVDFARREQARGIDGGAQGVITDELISDLEQRAIDNEEELFRTAYTNNIQLSTSGGADKFNYFMSGNISDQEGIMITNSYKRYALRTNVNSQISDKFKVGLNLYGSREINRNDPNQLNRTQGGPVVSALTTDPTLIYKDVNGNIPTTNYTSIEGIPNSLYVANVFGKGDNSLSPLVADLLASKIERRADRTNANINLEYKILDPLTYKAVFGLNRTFIRNNNFIIENGRQVTLNDIGEVVDVPPSGSERAISQNINRLQYQMSNIVNWNNIYGKHSIDLTGVFEFQVNTSESYRQQVSRIGRNVNNVFVAPSRADSNNVTINSSASEEAIVSYLGRLQYDFNKNLFVTASMRIDQSSKFTETNRTGYFPSAALAYSFRNLSFIENSNVISNLKLRASWGQTGNQNINNDAFSNQFQTLSIPVIVDGENRIVNTVDQTIEGNRDGLTWETTTQWDAGMDVSFFNNRLNFSFDYYEKTTDDLLLRTIFQPGIDIFRNVGSIENKGFDISLYGDVINNDSFTWTSGIAISHNKNKVIELNGVQDAITELTIDAVNGRGQLNRVEVGKPLGQLIGRNYLGVDEDGDAIFETRTVVNDDGTTSEEIIEDKELGNGTPSVTWGFNNTFNYKNFDLNLFVQGASGFEVYNQARAAIEGNVPLFEDNLTTSDVPTGNYLASSRYVEKGDFIRLSNLSLGYTIKKPLKGVNTAKITLSGQNLFLITDYSGYDPEVNSSAPQPNQVQGANVDTRAGLDLGAIPSPRVFSLGVKLGF